MFLLTNSKNIARVQRRNKDFESLLSSLNVLKGTLLRQRKLENNWFFKCICQRCQVGYLGYYWDTDWLSWILLRCKCTCFLFLSNAESVPSILQWYTTSGPHRAWIEPLHPPMSEMWRGSLRFRKRGPAFKLNTRWVDAGCNMSWSSSLAFGFLNLSQSHTIFNWVLPGRWLTQ